MLKRSKRFSFRTGIPKQKTVTPFFILRYQKSNDPKYAVVVSKSVSKKAVLRNRVKRLFIQQLQEMLLEKPHNYTLVFFLRRPCTDYSKSVIITELESVFERLDSIRPFPDKSGTSPLKEGL